MDWDFIIAMTIVSIAAVWGIWRIVRLFIGLSQTGKTQTPTSMCKDCPFYQKCNLEKMESQIFYENEKDPGSLLKGK